MTVFTLPDLGEGLQEAEIVTWHISPGDHVIADQPLLSVETDKAVVEVPAPYSGTVLRLIAEEGAVVPIGAPLVEIDTGQTQDAGAIVGQLDAPQTATPSEHPAKPERPPSLGAAGKASPAVRRLARERGVDLAVVAGSGPDGTILSHDVEAAASGGLGGGSGGEFGGGLGGEPLRGVRRAMARAMAKSHASVVPATVTDLADISAWEPGEAPTPRLVRAIVKACAAEPALNAWFDGGSRRLHENVDLAIAVDTTDGLFTPVLRNAGDAGGIAARIDALKRSVEDRSIRPEEMADATFTLSNFGMLGGRFAALVVSPPQVAILGAGRASSEVLAIAGIPTVGMVLPLSLSFDHRAVTGGEAARFLAAVRADLELRE